MKGFFASTAGLEETNVREYIRKQEKADKQQIEFEFKLPYINDMDKYYMSHCGI